MTHFAQAVRCNFALGNYQQLLMQQNENPVVVMLELQKREQI